MKKKIKRQVKAIRIERKEKTQSLIFYKRIIYIASFFAAIAGFFIIFNRTVMRQAVEGMSITRSLYEQATIALPSINGAVSYNIYYKQETDGEFTYSVRKLPATIRFYTISYLKKGINYQYRISAVNPSGSEFWWTPLTSFSSRESM